MRRNGRQLSRRFSDHIAYALLVYTGLHIFVTMGAMKTGQGSVLPYLALVVLVMAIVPACRLMQRRWDGCTENAADNAVLGARFRRDCLAVWLCAIGLPFAITGLFTLILPLF
ncbi:hypothetical protein GRI91_06785 [Altererythrobacter endophyticus]|uniref:Uncharacterized protein n=1 Tax=Altericroceibacterium endophyticum TaxID=1808508 RepID=A0A6I4T6L9_9SPHN|nr:hypothetical protein [Altericroceibacterium endophyticum]